MSPSNIDGHPLFAARPAISKNLAVSFKTAVKD
jgi:hypothetical protein